MKHALKGQPALSPGQSEVAPWVKSFVSGCALQGQKRNLLCKIIHPVITPYSICFCPCRALAFYGFQYPGRRFALPWARRGLPFQGVHVRHFPFYGWVINRLLYRRFISKGKFTINFQDNMPKVWKYFLAQQRIEWIRSNDLLPSVLY